MGLHFPYPPQRNPIVELVRTPETTDLTCRTVAGFLRSVGKEPVEVDNHCGLITTRMILPLINEAFHLVMEGVAGAADIDRTMKMSSGMLIPPLELADRMGLDVVLRTLDNCCKEFGDGKFRPCPLLQRLVREGRLGAKTGAGVYEYRHGAKVLPVVNQ
jgi:3-hydroxybutyryl-CoA dehydrogenase